MVRIVYIGTENKKRLDVIYKLENILLNKINTYDYNKIIKKLPSDVIDLIILNVDKCNKICEKIKLNNRLKHIPTISLIKNLKNSQCKSDLIVSDNVSDIEFLYQLNLLIKMKLIDDELKKETILLQLKITDRNIQLETKTERLRRAELFSKSGNWEFHIESNQMITSEGAMVIYDVDRNILSYDEIKKFSLPVYRNYLDNAMYDLLHHNKPYNVEFKIMTKKGEIKDIHSSAIYNKEKNIIFGVIQDITNKKKTEKKLEKSLSLFRATLESTADGILAVDLNGNIVEYNQKFLKMWNIPYDIISKMDDNLALEYASKQLKKPDEFLKRVKKLYYSNGTSSFDIIEFKDGRYFESYSLPQKINNENIGRVWSFQDITERIKKEEELKFNEKFRELLLNISSSYINLPLEKVDDEIIKTLELMGKFVKSDRAYIFDIDWEKEICINTYEWCNKNVEKQIHNLQNLPINYVKSWIDKHKKGEIINIKNVNDLTDDGVKETLLKQKIKSVISIPLMDNDKCIGFIGFDSVIRIHDYSIVEIQLLELYSKMIVNVKLRKKSEEELIKSKEKAEESNRLKTEFLGNISHEIRTPMNSILGFSSLINERTNHTKLNEYIEIIKNSGLLLMSIIESIMDLSEIQTGVFKINKKNVDIKNMFILSEEEYYQHLKYRNKDNLDLRLNIPKDKLIIHSDGERIKQVLNNLVINAIKFTDTGYIEYGYNIKGKCLEIYVKDTGMGISNENIQKIFEKFYQITNKNIKKYDGTGLGLTISKSIVEKLNGEITIDSVVGVGSTFKFTIPIIKKNNTYVKKDTIETINISDWSSKEILIVEDNYSNYLLLEILLKQTNINITHVLNGVDFYKIIKEKEFNLILLDLQLPDISGFDILEYIKKYTNSPVVIQTAFDNNDNIKKAFELNVDGYINKPIIWEKLYKEIKKHIK